MSNAAQPSLLRRLMGMRAAPQPEQDPADMGTAIGLDFCLDDLPAEPPLVPGSQGGQPAAAWLVRPAN